MVSIGIGIAAWLAFCAAVYALEKWTDGIGGWWDRRQQRKLYG